MFMKTLFPAGPGTGPWNGGGGGFPVHKFCLSCLGTASFPHVQGVLNQPSGATVGLGCERALEREAWGGGLTSALGRERQGEGAAMGLLILQAG